MKHEIIAVVRSNNKDAFVFKEMPKMVYTKFGDHTIIGTDGLFFTSYFFERPSENWKAFAGREFDIKLDNGTVEHCNGQWWDGMTETAQILMGVTKENKAIHVAAASIMNLINCYVFYAFKSTEKEIAALRATYTGPVYEYWEYEKMIKQQMKIV